MAALRSPTFFLYCAIAAVAALLRYHYAQLALAQDFFPALFLDSQHYAEIAARLATGRGAGDSAYVMSPLYPYFLWLFTDTQGELAVWAVRGVQMGAGVMNCLLIASLARHYAAPFGAGTLAAALGGGVAAIYGPLIHYETSILVEVMQGFTLLLALWLLVVRRPQLQSRFAQGLLWLGSGLLLGLAAGFRPVALLVLAITVLVFLLLSWWQHRSLRPLFAPCLLLLLGSSCAVLPFTIRNYVVAKEFVLLSAYGGMNFWIGNHKESRGLFNTPPDYGFALDPIGVELARKESGKNLSQKEASDWWSQRALNDIKEDPLRWLGLYSRKLFLFLHAREIPQLGNDFHWFAKRAWPLQFPLGALPLLLLALSLPLSALLFYREQVYRELLRRILLPYSWLLIYIAGISLFFITGRYRTPIMPVVMVLAATHSALLLKQLPNARTYLAALVMMIAIVFASVALTRTFNQSRWLPETALATGLVERQRGMAYYDQKNFVEAERWYRKSLAIKDHAITRGNLANALKAQGRIEEAEQEYHKALQSAPRDYVTWYNLGNLYRDYYRDTRRAAECYEKAIALNRKFAEPYLNLALLQLRSGQREAARRTVEAGLTALDDSQYKIREQLLRVKVELSLRKK